MVALDKSNKSSNKSKEDITRERIITILNQPTMTLSELEYIETSLHDILHLMKLNQLPRYQQDADLTLSFPIRLTEFELNPPMNCNLKSAILNFPVINPNKFTYNSFGKNDIVCGNCVHFTLPEALDSPNGRAEVCNDCFNGSTYHPYAQ